MTEKRPKETKKAFKIVEDQTKNDLIRKIEILYQIIQAISKGSSLEKTLNDIVEIIINITSADSCFIYLVDQRHQELILRASKNPHPRLLGEIKIKLGEGITGWAAKEKKPVSIPKNAYKDERFEYFRNIPEDKYESFLSIPIIAKDKVIGVINTQNKKPYKYNESIISFLFAIAGQLGSVIENTRLHEEIIKKAKQIETLSKVSKTVISERYLDGILNLIVTVTAEEMNSKICSLMIFDESKNELIIKATQSLSEEYRKKPHIKVGQSISGRVVEEKKAIRVLNVKKEKNYAYPDIAEKLGIVSLLSVPMMIEGRIIGVINVYTSAEHDFADEEVDLLQTIANQSAVAIERSKLAEEAIKAKKALAVRKLVEKAKRIIMKKNNVSEDEAYRMIQKTSMNTAKPMKEIAEAIILASEIEGT